jgi:hypothetical protein
VGNRGVYSVLLGKPEAESHLRRHRCRCVDNIRMDLWGCGGGIGSGWGSGREIGNWGDLGVDGLIILG